MIFTYKYIKIIYFLFFKIIFNINLSKQLKIIKNNFLKFFREILEERNLNLITGPTFFFFGNRGCSE